MASVNSHSINVFRSDPQTYIEADGSNAQLGILNRLFSALPDFFKTVLVSGKMRTVFVPDGQKIPGTLGFT